MVFGFQFLETGLSYCTDSTFCSVQLLVVFIDYQRHTPPTNYTSTVSKVSGVGREPHQAHSAWGEGEGGRGGDGKATTFLLWPLATRLYPPATRCESAWWYICLPRGLLTGEVQKKGFIRRAFNWQGRPFLGTLIHLRFVRYIKRQNVEANL